MVNPALAGVTYNFPVRAIGNESLTEESTQSFEVAYTGIINNRATVSAAVYFTENEDEIFFTQTGRYRAAAPPPGWPLPAVVLEVLPPPCTSAMCTTGGLPSEFSYRNLGTVKNKGFELGLDGAVNRALNVFVNYSWQAEPEPDFALSEINLPPTAPVQCRTELHPGPLPRQPVGELCGRRVLAGRARRAFRGTDRGVHADQRRVRRDASPATASRPRSR